MGNRGRQDFGTLARNTSNLWPDRLPTLATEVAKTLERSPVMLPLCGQIGYEHSGSNNEIRRFVTCQYRARSISAPTHLPKPLALAQFLSARCRSNRRALRSDQ